MASRTTLSLDEYARLPEDEFVHELDEGELIVSPRPGLRHGVVQVKIAALLSVFVEKNGLGLVVVESGFVLGPDTLRGPDIAFISKERMASLDESGTWPAGAPDLAVEVVSPSDSAVQIEKKTGQYLNAGAHAVWVVYPDTRTVHVFESGGAARVLGQGSVLEAPRILPGFSVPVARFFE